MATIACAAPSLSHAASFSVGGGTITTTDADNVNDATGTGGVFELQANSTTTGDQISISGVAINNSSTSPTAIEIGNVPASSGTYAIHMQGSTLSGKTGFGGGALFAQTRFNGVITLDTTGGAPNTVTGSSGYQIWSYFAGGAVIKTGADVITVVNTPLFALDWGNSPVSIDSVGAILTATNGNGIDADTNGGAITIGGLNGGIASTINANHGYGIIANTGSTGGAPISVKLAASGSITANNGGINVTSAGGLVSVDTFGSINATDPGGLAIFAGSTSKLTATLESGSTTIGKVLGGTGATTINIFTGADISGASFAGGSAAAANQKIDLKGAGIGALNLNKISNITSIQKDDAGTWTLVSAGPVFSAPPLQINDGTLVGSTNTVTGAVTIQSPGVLQLDQTTSGNLNVIIAGTGSLLKSGSGTVTLTRPNTFSGITTIDSGVLRIGDGSFDEGSLAGNIVDNSVFAIVRSDIATLNNTISGTGSLQQSGSAATILTGANLYTGGTLISSGTLQLGNGGTTGSIIGDIVDNATLTISRSNAITLAGAISGTGALQQVGTGTTVLTGTNTYSGGTAIPNGTLAVSADTNLGDANGPIAFGGGGLQFGASFDLALTRAITLSGYGRFDTNGFGTVLAQPITGSGILVKIGAGTLVLTGASTFSGSTSIFGGAVQLGNGGATGSISGNVVDEGLIVFNRSNAVTFGGTISGTGGVWQSGDGTTTLTGSNTYSGGTTIPNGTLAVSSDANLGDANGPIAFGGGGLQFGASFNLASTRAITLSGYGRFDTNGFATFLAQPIGGTGVLVKTGAGTLVLTGTSTYSGSTAIFGGALQLGNGGTTGSISGNVFDDGLLVFNRFNNVTFGGVISGTGGVWQSGAGTTTLTGNNTYSGGTTIPSGTLAIASDVNLGDPNGPILFGGGGLQFGASFTLASTRAITLSGYGRFDTNGFTNVIGQAIGGSGILVKIGAGTLVLAGTNTYNGSTSVLGGVLQLGNGGTSGSIIGNVVDNGTLDFNRSDNVTFDGVISGTGEIRQSGTGTTTLTADNHSVFGGLITIANGTLAVESRFSLGGDTNTSIVFSGGTLKLLGNPFILNKKQISIATSTSGTIDTNGFNVDAFTISGGGALIKAGAGTLYLWEDNTYTGGTTIAGGTLVLGNSVGGPFSISQLGSVLGDVTDNGTLAFKHTNNFTFNGVISGTGAVNQLGTGTTTLTATNSYSGGTILTNGTLLVSSDANLGDANDSVTLAGGTLRFGAGFTIAPTRTITLSGGIIDTNGFDTTIAQSMTGSSQFGLLKLGLGALTLSGANTYTGPTKINAGTLIVSGSITSPVTVNSGGALRGNGTVGTTTVASNGTLLPGSFGTLTIAGDLTFQSGSNYAVNVSPTVAERTNVLGAASIAGKLLVDASPGSYSPRTYTVINSGNPLSGTFASVAYTGTFGSGVTPLISYDANNVYLTLQPVASMSLAAVAPEAISASASSSDTTTQSQSSPQRPSIVARLPGEVSNNQAEVAAAIDTAIARGAGIAFQNLLSTEPDQLAAALGQFSAKTGIGIAQTGFDNMSDFLHLALDPSLSGRDPDSLGIASDVADLPLGFDGVKNDVAPLGGPIGIWGATYGGWNRSTIDPWAGSHGFNGSNGGLIAGIDVRPAGTDLVAGAAIGFGRSWRSLSRDLGDGQTGMQQVAVYARKRFDQYFVSVGAAMSRADADTKRSMSLGGDSVYAAHFQSETTGLRLEGGRRFALGDGLWVTPYAAYEAERMHMPGYAEQTVSGASVYALLHRAEDQSNAVTELGGQIDRVADIAGGPRIQLHGGATWVHDYSGTPHNTMAFGALAGSDFTIYGASRARDVARISAGAEIMLDKRLSAAARVRSDIGAGEQAIDGSAYVSYRW